MSETKMSKINQNLDNFDEVDYDDDMSTSSTTIRSVTTAAKRTTGFVTSSFSGWASSAALWEDNTTDFGTNCTFVNGTASHFVFSYNDSMAAG